MPGLPRARAAKAAVQTTVTVPDVNPGVHELELQGEGVGGLQVTEQVLIRVAGRPSGGYTTYLCCFQLLLPARAITGARSVADGRFTVEEALNCAALRTF